MSHEETLRPISVKDFFVPIGTVAGFLVIIIPVVMWITNIAGSVRSHEERLAKIEIRLDQDDQKINDLTQQSAIQNTLLKGISDKLDDLKKSLDQLQSQVTMITNK